MEQKISVAIVWLFCSASLILMGYLVAQGTQVTWKKMKMGTQLSGTVTELEAGVAVVEATYQDKLVRFSKKVPPETIVGQSIPIWVNTATGAPTDLYWGFSFLSPKFFLTFFILALFSCGFGYSAFSDLNRTTRILGAGQQVEAEVVSITKTRTRSSKRSSTRRRGGFVYRATYRYEFQGSPYEVVARAGSPWSPQVVGDKVSFLVDPKNPTDFMTDSFFDRWGLALGFVIFGLLLSFFGYGVAFASIKIVGA